MSASPSSSPTDERHEYLFLLNHDPGTPVAVPVEGEGTDLLTGLPVSGEITLPALGAAVVRRARRP
ncbi:Beta-galactosidase C-terminal domain [Microbispora sp. NPDC088329]|uniref:Beta-galactosidase C-terminal domain n=1 Tax=Microbispora sp. NPDC088329 TaxID=3154869 RepID=UPI003413A00B